MKFKKLSLFSSLAILPVATTLSISCGNKNDVPKEPSNPINNANSELIQKLETVKTNYSTDNNLVELVDGYKNKINSNSTNQDLLTQAGNVVKVFDSANEMTAEIRHQWFLGSKTYNNLTETSRFLRQTYANEQNLIESLNKIDVNLEDYKSKLFLAFASQQEMDYLSSLNLQTSLGFSTTIKKTLPQNYAVVDMSGIVDGDTLYGAYMNLVSGIQPGTQSTNRRNGKSLGLRSRGIDTPETDKGSNSDELASKENYWAHISKKYYVEQVQSHGFFFYFNKLKEDDYGRWVVLLYPDERKNPDLEFGNQLIRAGLARVAYITLDPSDTKFYAETEEEQTMYHTIKNSQNYAKENRLGFWVDPIEDVFYKNPRKNW
ncbi:thermonuclease family protein [Mycoplasma sp. 1199]|uniref:thermonuclease family protein n=1 Tax=Mycoplasma sp. 1199 TaxID=3108526 RepID=UPI002B1DB2AF|nr:thermonuclease family protein [Mycoplasma sp. 1199]MEA4206303.1 thermonuclease family protein [Mycoplasma sp. 1199]